MTVAALDLGTNSTRLLVARPAGDGGLDTLDRHMTITRMGQGVGATGRLAPEAVERTLDTLRRYRTVMDAHGVDSVRVAATSAARDAANRDEFFDAVEQVVGARPELLSGDEEGRLAFRGATGDLDPARGPFLVVDIGGGSTEFIVGTTGAEGVMSIDVGCVRLTEKYIEHDPPLPEELTACISLTDAYLEDVVRELPGAAEAATLVGVAGTVSTVAAVETEPVWSLLVEYSKWAVVSSPLGLTWALRVAEVSASSEPRGSCGSVGPMSTRLRGVASLGMPAISWIEEPRPSIALVISEGMTHTLLALPSAIFGIIWRYW